MSEPGRMTTDRETDRSHPPPPPSGAETKKMRDGDRDPRADVLSALSRRVAARRDGGVNSCSHLDSQHVSPPLRSPDASSQQMRRGGEQIFDVPGQKGGWGAGGGGNNNVGTLFWCVLAGGEGRRNPPVLSADALCMRSGRC